MASLSDIILKSKLPLYDLIYLYRMIDKLRPEHYINPSISLAEFFAYYNKIFSYLELNQDIPKSKYIEQIHKYQKTTLTKFGLSLSMKVLNNIFYKNLHLAALNYGKEEHNKSNSKHINFIQKNILEKALEFVDLIILDKIKDPTTMSLLKQNIKHYIKSRTKQQYYERIDNISDFLSGHTNQELRISCYAYLFNLINRKNTDIDRSFIIYFLDLVSVVLLLEILNRSYLKPEILFTNDFQIFNFPNELITKIFRCDFDELTLFLSCLDPMSLNFITPRSNIVYRDNKINDLVLFSFKIYKEISHFI